MKNKIALFVFGILAIATIGCKSTIEDENTAYLDAIIANTKANLDQVNELDLNQIQKMSEVYDGYLDYFRAEYDSLENGPALLPDFDKLGGCAKKFNKVQGEIIIWKEELEEGLEKFEALRHDYSNKLISKEELDSYLAVEMIAISEVDREFNEHIPGAKNCIENFKPFTDKLDSIRIAHIKTHE